MTQDDVNQQEWKNPANWSRWFYRSERDSRLWVPKRPSRLSRGATLNMAKPGSTAILWGLAVTPVALILLAVLLAVRGS